MKKKTTSKRLTPEQKLSYYKARIHKGDSQLLAEMTGYSYSHINNVKDGRRGLNEDIVNAMYKLSAKRKELA